MSLYVDSYKDGTYLAQCDRCGQLQYADEMEEPPAQVPGGGPSGLFVCRRHRVVYQPLNDLPFVIAQYDDPTPAPIPRLEKTVSVAPTIAVPIITTAVYSAPTLTVTGSGFSSFLPRSAVRWDSNPLPTTYVSATSLTAAIPTALATSGAHTVDVWNVGPPELDDSSLGTGLDLNNQNLSNAVTVTI